MTMNVGDSDDTLKLNCWFFGYLTTFYKLLREDT
jgi:hypothetical protein